MKKGILFLGILVLVLVVSSVSAALCKGNDGYYHDCGYRYGYGSHKNYMDYGYGKNLDYSYGKNINNDYRKNTVYRDYDQYKGSQYISDYIIKNTYYITYEDRSNYRTYDNYYEKSNRRVYFSSYKEYDKNYNKGKNYNVRNHYKRYDFDYGYSNKRINYKIVRWVYEKSDGCPWGWSCFKGNRVY